MLSPNADRSGATGVGANGNGRSFVFTFRPSAATGTEPAR